MQNIINIGVAMFLVINLIWIDHLKHYVASRAHWYIGPVD